MKLFRELVEKSSYEIYHNTYSAAIQAAEDYAIKQGYEIDPEEMADKVGLGPAKPKPGKTVKHTISLTKNGKPQKKALQIQVYNRETNGNEFELNTYIS
jgi:hypothetical protein